MVYRGVVAIVAIFNGRKLVGEQLRFIPLSQGGDLLAAGDKRLRLTGARRGDTDPARQEKSLDKYAGRVIAAEAADYDDEWLYGCVDISRQQA